MTKKQLIKVAKLEIEEWKGLPPGLVMVILWAFVHRVTTGETVEESFRLTKQPDIDFQI
jgi:hypothetical protein